ncbi:MAG: hypothetical protein WA131_09390 [Desulfitobacteriaceae bacterium]
MKVKKSVILVFAFAIVISAVVFIVYNSLQSSGDRVTIVGATWDLPTGTATGIDFSNPNDLQDNIETAARSLAYGEKLIVAGEANGPISEKTYQAIIQRAKLINPNFKGSITRMGGVDRYETQKKIDDYLNKKTKK